MSLSSSYYHLMFSRDIEVDGKDCVQWQKINDGKAKLVVKKKDCTQKREVDDNIKEECYHSQKKLIEVYDN